MSSTDRWLLPEGIEEALPAEAARLERLRRALIDLYHTWGYELVMPPFIEYLESLLTGTGHDLDLQTFKLIDQLTGRLLGVRADMTPQVARIDAHHLRREAPVRLCYLGTVLHTLPDGFAGSRSPLQVGAELYGHAGAESDVEVLSLMLQTLRVSGVEQVHVDVGHVGVFRVLAREAGLDEEREQALFDALQRKARAEIEALLVDAPEASRRMLAGLVDLNGEAQVLDQARELLREAGEQAHAALANLSRIARIMALRMPDTPIYFDLAELRGYKYQTGAVFAAFVPGHGQEIARGGRYDAIGRVFGRARPATGFSTDLKTLSRLSSLAPPPAPQAVLAPWSEDPALEAAVQRLRGEGRRVVQALPDQAGGAAELGCTGVLVSRGDQWVVEPAG